MATARSARIARDEAAQPLHDDSEPRRRHLRVVRPRRWAHVRLTPRAGVTLTVLMFVGLFGVAGSHALLIESQSRLDRLDGEVAEEQAEYERRRLEVAQLESPERIMHDAAEQGMVAPNEVVWLTPDQAAAGTPGTDQATTTDSADGAGSETETDTSWTEVKPYLGSTP